MSALIAIGILLLMLATGIMLIFSGYPVLGAIMVGAPIGVVIWGGFGWKA